MKASVVVGALENATSLRWHDTSQSPLEAPNFFATSYRDLYNLDWTPDTTLLTQVSIFSYSLALSAFHC